MKVSIITPTADRSPFLHRLYRQLQQQTYPDWEWLIYDTSLHPETFSDPRISYYHTSEILSIGEKRNRLLERAQGECIIHCDDDDYYAPNYLSHALERLSEADFFKFTSWFSYHMQSGQFYYWATDEQSDSKYIVSPLLGSQIRETDIPVKHKGEMGYGFSYAYKRAVAETCEFPDCDFGEDWRFLESALESGFSLKTAPDQTGLAVHVIHETNTCQEYPQYRIPRFLAEHFLPDFFTYAT